MRLRAAPEDFRVDEIPLYPPAGEGNHTFVRVEKRLRTTEEVARALARFAGASSRDVGYAGRKDRRAVSTQWFSVPALSPERALAFEVEGARAVEAVRHPHKLRTGHLRGNRFRVVVRGVTAAQVDAARAALERLSRRGMRNRFGPQRFGREGDNAERARAILSGGRASDRREARFLLSALQALVFNDVLAARGEAFDALEAGDVAVVHASGGLFVVRDPAREAPRAAAFEVSATGPIFGAKVQKPEGTVLSRERAALAARGVDPDRLRPPRGIRMRGARRALRVRPAEAQLSLEGDGAVLCFALPAGSYATVLVEEVFPGASDDTARAPGVSSTIRQEVPLP